jgi:membrane-anchored mycosin MYCP
VIRGRICGALAVAAILVTQSPPVPAGAITPPVVDSSQLPDPAPAAPPRPTVQRQTCTVPAQADADGSAHVANSPTALGLDALHALTRGAGQRVAVIDTGVTPHHRLARLEAGGDYVSSGDGTQDCDGHGTIVAGIIAAAPDPSDVAAFAGVAPAATILSIRQSSMKFGVADDPAVTGSGDVDTMAMAVRTAADAGATVINISSVACTSGQLSDGALGAALAYAVDTKDVVVVAAAGNVGGISQCPNQSGRAASSWESATVAVSPAWYDDYVLTVGSVGSDGSSSSFSMPGPWVDVAAPGEQLVSLNPVGSGLVDTLPAFDRTMPISGTSYAAPVVSGIAALVRSRFPELTARQVMQRIETTAHNPARGWDSTVGNGVVDPLAAVSADAPQRATPPEGVHKQPVASDQRFQPDTRGRTTAMLGVGVCAAVLSGALTLARLRRTGRRYDITRDERSIAAQFRPGGQG